MTEIISNKYIERFVLSVLGEDLRGKPLIVALELIERAIRKALPSQGEK